MFLSAEKGKSIGARRSFRIGTKRKVVYARFESISNPSGQQSRRNDTVIIDLQVLSEGHFTSALYYAARKRRANYFHLKARSCTDLPYRR